MSLPVYVVTELVFNKDPWAALTVLVFSSLSDAKEYVHEKELELIHDYLNDQVADGYDQSVYFTAKGVFDDVAIECDFGDLMEEYEASVIDQEEAQTRWEIYERVPQ